MVLLAAERRTRGQPARIANNDQIGEDGDVPELDSKELQQEMATSRQVRMQELGSTHCSAYAVKAPQEPKADSALAELLNVECDYTSPVPHHVPQQPPADTAGYSVSANVEAQRRREMEWLEMEEERIRKRRELLALQGGTPN
jgi:flagellar basal body rod protein FlgC